MDIELKSKIEEWQMQADQLAQSLSNIKTCESIMNLFTESIKTEIPLTSLFYLNKQHNLNIKIGKLSQHSANYRLKLEDKDMGEILITGENEFNEYQLVLLEMFITKLLHPLEKALETYKG